MYVAETLPSTDQPPTEPRSLSVTEIPQSTAAVAPVPVVVDSSVFDPKKPYLFVTLGNHTVHPSSVGQLGFDASSNRLISFVSVHDRCGAIVSTKKHMSSLQGLGYPVVEWGQKIAFPMASRDIRKSGTGEPYTGGLIVHTFTEPMSLHNREKVSDGTIVADGLFDGLNHLAGAYIPLALALQCATGGDTQVNLVTTNSGRQEEDHSVEFLVGTNSTSICFKDDTGGTIAANNVVTACTGCEHDTMPLVIGQKQIRPGFEGLMQRMSGSPDSFISSLVEKVGLTVGNGMFSNYDKKLESDIRLFMSDGKPVADTGSDADTQPLQINMGDLPPKLQTQYCTASMVAMRQPFPIAAPTVVVQSAEPDTTGVSTDTPVADVAAAALYGDRFSTCSYALEPHFNLTERGISNGFGPVAFTHALMLSQVSLAEAEKVCIPFANPNSAFLPCKNTACDCNTECASDDIVPDTVVTPVVSTKFERMLLGVSQNMALSNTRHRMRVGNSVMTVPVELHPPPCKPNPKDTSATDKPSKPDTKCTAAIHFNGTCRCKQCIDTCRFLHLGQMVASTTHAFQKYDNYVSDQTVCCMSAKGVPQYASTECMLPFMTLAKSIMMKCTEGKEDEVVLRVGMNTDDCENSAFQTKAVMDTLSRAAKCVNGALFHTVNGVATPQTGAGILFPYSSLKPNASPEPDATTSCTTTATANDEEEIRQLHLGSLSTQDQRRALLCIETLGARIDTHLAYFVTGAASKASDVKHPSTAVQMASKLTPTDKTVPISNIHKHADGSVSGHVFELPVQVGNGLNAFGSKKPIRKLVDQVESNSHGGTIKDTAATESALSGHCTCTLSVTRDDGFIHTVIVEGTAPVAMSAGDTPFEISHRSTLGTDPVDDTKPIGVDGKYNETIATDNCVDMSVKACMTSQVNCIANRIAIPGSSMRPQVHVATGMGCDQNMNSFYNMCVSTGGNQFIQLDEEHGIQPGADVKTLVNQRLCKSIDLATAVKGDEAIKKEMGTAKIAMVKVIDHKDPGYIKYEKDAMSFSQGMSPLRLSPEHQERYMLNPLGNLSTLKVNFPDSANLDKQHGKNTKTFFVTHVANDDSTEGRAVVLASLQHLTKQLNNDYLNVRFSSPMMLPTGEMVTHYKMYGMKKDLLLV